MGPSVDEYVRASEEALLDDPHVDSQINPNACVLETLALLDDTHVRYIIADNFGYAVSYCWRRLFVDLVAPEERGSDTEQAHWEKLRAGFAPADLALAWSAARRAFVDLLGAFTSDGYAPELADRLREIVNQHGLDLELGEIFALPQDVEPLLAHVGSPFVWWDDAIESAEQAAQPFDFENEAHREMLARRLREANRHV